MLRKSIALALFLLGIHPQIVCAQEYSFHYLGVSEGLNNLAVRRIYQDHAGFIWVSTENGIFRYDGERFEAFGPDQGIPSNSSAAFGTAPDGSLLVGGDFGLFHLTGNRFQELKGQFKIVSWAQGIQSDGKGHTYLGTETGLQELSSNPERGRPGQGEFAARLLPQPPGTSGPAASGIFVDGDTLWYGCGHELCRVNSAGTTVYGRESGLPDRDAQVILKDREGNLWVRSRYEGVFELRMGRASFERPDPPVPGGTFGGTPAIDADGRVLLPSSDGLLILNEKGWQKVDRSMGLRGTVYAAFEDRQHSLWVGLAGRGLAQWRGYREWESYSTASGLGSDIVYEILPQNDGSLWVGTESGLFLGERRQSGIQWKRVAALGSSPAHSLQMDSGGNVWIGTETKGVARLDVLAGSVEWFGENQGLAGKAAYTVRFDREHRLWVATEAGLFMSLPPYQRFSRVTELPATRIWAVAEGTDGTIWAGGAGGLFEYTAGHWTTKTRADGLSNQEVLSLGAGENGTMWVGYRYGGGIDRIHPKPDGHGHDVTIEKGVQRPGSDGLVYFLDFDASGRLWVGTERGVDMWDGSRWSHYDTSDGLAWDDCNLNSFAETADGTIWIGTSGGLSRFKPISYGSSQAPEVVFTKLFMGRTDVSGLSNPSFRAPSNSLIARYSVPNAPRENEIVFRYRLEGANSAWTETAQRELQFAKLAPGEYRLEVEAQDGFGVWSAYRAEFPFRILTPWYWSWWFISFCALIPFSVVMVTIRVRMVGARKRELELVRLVEEKTVDLQRANDELSRLSYTDSLTGLANRRIFDQTLEKECARMKRTGCALSLLMLDVDRFKALNDSEGHQRGDEYLTLLAAQLTANVRRKSDLVARYGGEEFAVILPESSKTAALEIAESMRLAIESLALQQPASKVLPYLTISAGVVTAQGWTNPEELIAAADLALYAAKRSGRNRVVAAPFAGIHQNEEDPAAVNPS